ncbi:DUF421 domain-containing protein [Paenibacillus sp. TRM 82003]|nr:DUF421 domain-containing protein [Paenibacillus sp. TRM 82003]
MDKLPDLLLVTIRTTTIFPLMLLAALFMGKRSVGELPVFDLLVVLTLGSVVGADIADPSIEHVHTAAAIVLIVLMERLVSWSAIRFRRFRRIVSFEPTVVVYRGKLLDQNIARIRYTIDNVLQMLRDRGVFDVSDVDLGIVEGNGNLTVLQKGMPYSFTLIVEGVVNDGTLRREGLSEEWLRGKLRERGISSFQEVFYASISSDGTLHVSRKHEDRTKAPRFRH